MSAPALLEQPGAWPNLDERSDMPDRTCSVDGCDKPHHSSGFCGPHASRFKRHGDPLAGGPPRQRGRTCSLDGCDRRHDSHGFCAMHLIRWRETGDPGEPESRRYSNTTTVCTVDGCDGSVKVLDLCNKHGLRLKRHGHPLAGGRWRPVGTTSLGRLQGFIDVAPNGCWLWNGALTAQGYGWVKPHKDAGPTQAHRWAYELLVGPVGPGLHLDHVCHSSDQTCRVWDDCPHRACVNPDHLEPLTPAEHARRAHR